MGIKQPFSITNESTAGADASVKAQRHDLAIPFARAIEWEMIDIIVAEDVKSSKSILMAAETVQLCSSFFFHSCTYQ